MTRVSSNSSLSSITANSLKRRTRAPNKPAAAGTGENLNREEIMNTCTILSSALLVSALSFSDGAHLRPPARPALTVQAGTDQPFGTMLFSPDGKRLAGVAVVGHHG